MQHFTKEATMIEKVLLWFFRASLACLAITLAVFGLAMYAQWTEVRVWKKAVVEANKVCPECGNYCDASPDVLCVFEKECRGSSRWRKNYLLFPFPSARIGSCNFIRGKHPELDVDFLIIDGPLIAGYRWRKPPKPPANEEAAGWVSVFDGTEQREIVRCWRDGASTECPR
jgi:hypothetical protein